MVQMGLGAMHFRSVIINGEKLTKCKRALLVMKPIFSIIFQLEKSTSPNYKVPFND